MGLLPVSGWMMGGGGGMNNTEIAMTEEQFTKGYTFVHYSAKTKLLSIDRKNLSLCFYYANFSPEAKTGRLYFHYNETSEATGKHWKYKSIYKTINLQEEIGENCEKNWTLTTFLPFKTTSPEQLKKYKWYLCIKCFKTKEMINDMSLEIEK